MTLYRYGPLAWVWRIVAAAALVGGFALVGLAVRLGDWTLALVALPLLLPALTLGWVVAVKIDLEGDHLVVRTLGFARRRIGRGELGSPRLRLTASTEFLQVPAPRIWVPVRGGLPVYVDLWAEIPDLSAFVAVIPLSPAVQRALRSD